jgi:hypothetical protein
MAVKILVVTLLFAVATIVVMADSPAYEKELVLKIGTESVVPDSDTALRFVEVLEDSRCPEGVDCIWAGVARIKLEASGRNGRKHEIFLDTLDGTDTAVHADLMIRLIKVDPYPKADTPIKPDAYAVTLALSRCDAE